MLNFTARSHLSRFVTTLALTSACVIAPSLALAQAWPTKPVTFIVPFPAGGGTDAFARPFAAALSKNTGKQFIIDNRGGAGGTLGAGIAAKAAPDGYTFFIGAVHHSIAPAMYPKLDYDIEKSFVPVALLSWVPQVIVVNPQKVAANDLKGFVEAARAGNLNYGSAGNGTSHHLAGELFNIVAGTKITHIPYKGAGPAMQDLIGGQVDVMFDGFGSSAAHIKGGKIKPIVIASERRIAGYNIPTAKESGLDYTVATWYGIFAPRGTPPEMVAAMQAEMKKAFAAEELKTTWAGLGAEPPNSYGDAFGKFVNDEIKRWANVVKSSGAKLD